MMNILNKEKIAELSNEIGAENLPMLLEIFLGELKTYKQTLDDGPENITDYLKEISHALKSSAASFGADKLCQYAIDIDRRGKNHEPIDAVADGSQMTALLQETIDCYQGYFAG